VANGLPLNWPRRRDGDLEDDIVSFLVSDDARWITGVAIESSGGAWLGPPAA
jgi:hypothetical protein